MPSVSSRDLQREGIKKEPNEVIHANDVLHFLRGISQGLILMVTTWQLVKTSFPLHLSLGGKNPAHIRHLMYHFRLTLTSLDNHVHITYDM